VFHVEHVASASRDQGGGPASNDGVPDPLRSPGRRAGNLRQRTRSHGAATRATREESRSQGELPPRSPPDDPGRARRAEVRADARGRDAHVNVPRGTSPSRARSTDRRAFHVEHAGHPRSRRAGIHLHADREGAGPAPRRTAEEESSSLDTRPCVALEQRRWNPARIHPRCHMYRPGQGWVKARRRIAPQTGVAPHAAAIAPVAGDGCVERSTWNGPAIRTDVRHRARPELAGLAGHLWVTVRAGGPSVTSPEVRAMQRRVIRLPAARQRDPGGAQGRHPDFRVPIRTGRPFHGGITTRVGVAPRHHPHPGSCVLRRPSASHDGDSRAAKSVARRWPGICEQLPSPAANSGPGRH
jgi:hypothetical protein